jgi:hypothetical protein
MIPGAGARGGLVAPACETLHAEKIAGESAAAPAPSAEDRKWRRVKRKAVSGLLQARQTAREPNSSFMFDEHSVLLAGKKL